MYISEIERINNFFILKMEQMKQEFQDLKLKFEARLKMESFQEIDKKILGQEKDDFEYATSWKRAF